MSVSFKIGDWKYFKNMDNHLYRQIQRWNQAEILRFEYAELAVSVIIFWLPVAVWHEYVPELNAHKYDLVTVPGYKYYLQVIAGAYVPVFFMGNPKKDHWKEFVVIILIACAAVCKIGLENLQMPKGLCIHYRNQAHRRGIGPIPHLWLRLFETCVYVYVHSHQQSI